MSPGIITCAFSLCLDLGLGVLKVPKEADKGGRATSGSTRKGKRQHSSPQNPLLDCSLCGKVFSSASSLSKHYLTHSQERRHVCKICSKAFKRQDHLYVGVWSGRLFRGLLGAGRVPGSFASPPIHLHRPPPSGVPGVCDLCSSHGQCLGGQGLHCPGQPALPSLQIHSSEESAAAICRQDSCALKTHSRGNFVTEGVGLTL